MTPTPRPDFSATPWRLPQMPLLQPTQSDKKPRRFLCRAEPGTASGADQIPGHASTAISEQPHLKHATWPWSRQCARIMEACRGSWSYHKLGGMINCSNCQSARSFLLVHLTWYLTILHLNIPTGLAWSERSEYKVYRVL